jgi:hypothetical protein
VLLPISSRNPCALPPSSFPLLPFWLCGAVSPLPLPASSLPPLLLLPLLLLLLLLLLPLLRWPPPVLLPLVLASEPLCMRSRSASASGSP